MKIIITMPDSWLGPDGIIADEYASDAVDYIGQVRDEIMNANSSGHVDAEKHWTTERDVPRHLTADGFFEAQKRSNDEGYY